MSDKVLMPKALTAENGAKALLMGEFKQELPVFCHECSDLDEVEDGCPLCHGEGEFIREVNISWTNIKDIYANAVEHFGVEPGDSVQKRGCE